MLCRVTVARIHRYGQAGHTERTAAITLRGAFAKIYKFKKSNPPIEADQGAKKGSPKEPFDRHELGGFVG